MTASVIKVTTLTSAMLVSSTAPEAVAATYAGGTTYGLGDRAGLAPVYGAAQLVYESQSAGNVGNALPVPPATSTTYWKLVGTVYPAYDTGSSCGIGGIVSDLTGHMLYESLVSANTGNALTDATKWLPTVPTNPWQMFDRKIGTATELQASPITVVAKPGPVQGFALMGLVGPSATVTMKSATSGTVVFSATKDLDGTPISDVYDWLFMERVQLSDWVVTGLPVHHFDPEITVSVTSTAGAVACGVCHFGLVTDLGDAQYGAKAGILDWSKKTRDAFGNYDVTPGAYSKRCTLSLMTEKADFAKIHRFLASLSGSLNVFIGTEADGYEPLTVYGFPKSFEIDVAYPTKHLCALEIEGVN